MHAGRYSQWYGQSFQRSPGALTSEQNVVLDQIIASQNNPTTLATFNVEHGFGVGGWVAVPTTTNPPTSELDPNAPVGRFRRIDASGTRVNSCAFPSAFGAPNVRIKLK